MSSVEKVKIGLDECRMLALGAQVLIGFQFQGVFQPGFVELPPSSKVAQIGGLLLLLASLGGSLHPGGESSRSSTTGHAGAFEAADGVRQPGAGVPNDFRVVKNRSAARPPA
jgi:hypothetical protein